MTYKADYLWLESHLVLSLRTLQQPYCPFWHCWPGMYQAWGLYAALCYNESWIPTTNVLNYDFVSCSLIGWASNNTEEGISQLGRSPVPMLPFQITGGPHIKGTQRLSLWSKQTTNKQTNIGSSQSLGLVLQWEELISKKLGELDWNRLLEQDMKVGITLHTFDTAKFWYWYQVWFFVLSTYRNFKHTSLFSVIPQGMWDWKDAFRSSCSRRVYRHAWRKYWWL